MVPIAVCAKLVQIDIKCCMHGLRVYLAHEGQPKVLLGSKVLETWVVLVICCAHMDAHALATCALVIHPASLCSFQVLGAHGHNGCGVAAHQLCIAGTLLVGL